MKTVNMRIKDKKINSNIRICAAIAATVLIHMPLFLFSQRKTTIAPFTLPQYKVYLLSESNMRKSNALFSAIKLGSSSFILAPNIEKGFTSLTAIPKIRFSSPPSTNIQIQSVFDSQSKEKQTVKQLPERLTEQGMITTLSFSPIFFPDILRSKNTTTHEYPLVFDCYGRNIKHFADKLKTMDSSRAKTYTEIEFRLNGPGIPSFRISSASSDNSLDQKVAQILHPLAITTMEKSGETRLIVRILWRE